MPYTISKRFRFCASHILNGLPDGHKCGRLHGHNYEIELVLASQQLDQTGFVVDYGHLHSMQTFIDDNLDHRHLNEVIPGQPSAERIAEWLFEKCSMVLAPQVAALLVALRVSETPMTWAEFRP